MLFIEFGTATLRVRANGQRQVLQARELRRCASATLNERRAPLARWHNEVEQPIAVAVLHEWAPLREARPQRAARVARQQHRLRGRLATRGKRIDKGPARIRDEDFLALGGRYVSASD